MGILYYFIEMTFEKILKNSWNDYKKNFKSIFNFMFVFKGIPIILFTLISIYFIFNDTNVYNLFISEINYNNPTLPWYYLITSWIFGLIMLLLFLFISGALTSLSLRKTKFSYKELTKEGRSVFSKYLLYNIVYVFFLFLLFLLLIIPGIIFFVYWIFGPYVLFDKKKTISQSLKESRYIVKGRWWKVFGYISLIALIYLGIAIIFGIISLPFYIIQFMSTFNGTILSPRFFVFSSIFSAISSFLTELVALPLNILFFKNFYSELKKKR